MTASLHPSLFGDRHVALLGASGTGKSFLQQAIARTIAKNPEESFSFIDVHGESARAIAEWLANPINGCSDRALHVFNPADSLVMGINPFQLPKRDDSWEAVHDAALAWASIVESQYDAAPELTPRLSRLMYVAGMIIARKGLTLLEMCELFSLGAHELRRSLLQDFDNRIVRTQMQDLITLAEKHPREFLTLTESCLNRLARWLGDKRLARVFGQRHGLDAREVMDGQILLADLSALSHDDAAFLGTCLTALYFRAARTRAPHASRMHRLIIDESEAMLCKATAQVLDQTRKFGLTGIFSLQRLGQVRDKGEFVTNALMVNATIKIVFGIPEPVDARYLAEQLFTGHIDLAEWKPGTERPVVVGHDRVLMRSRSRAQHHAENTSASVSDMTSVGHVVADMTTEMSSWGDGLSSGLNGSYLSAPSSIMGAGAPMSQGSSVSRGRNSMRSGARAAGSSRGKQAAQGSATSRSHSSADGQSSADGEAEALLPRMEWMPSQTYSLEEQLSRLTGEIMSLPRRECFVQIGSQRPYRARTADLRPPFTCLEYRNERVPRFLAAAARRSPYLRPAAAIDAEIAARYESGTRESAIPDPENWADDVSSPIDPSIFAELKAQSREVPPVAPTRKKPHLRVVESNPPDDPLS
jgi:hypothetical protein